MLSQSPYIFSRSLGDNQVVVGLDLPSGSKSMVVNEIFADGTELVDHYSGQSGIVKDGKVKLETQYDIVLLSK